MVPFCPQCRAEYIEGKTQCSDCGVQLVDSLPPSVPPRDIHWVELRTAGTEAEGEMLADVLEQNGIPVMLKKDVFASGFGRQGTLLFVPAEQRDEAEALTRDISAPDDGSPEDVG